jgi:hypothetical protein
MYILEKPPLDIHDMIPLKFDKSIHAFYPVVDDPLDDLLEIGSPIPERFIDDYANSSDY